MTKPESARTLAEDLLAHAAEDWLSAAEVIDLMRQTGLADPLILRDLAIGLISRLIANDLLVAGDIDGSEHVPWVLSPAESILRIVREWTAEADPFVMPGEIVWLNTTKRGQVMGESVWQREAGQWT